MLNRRLLRVKAFKVLFGKVASGMDSLQSAEKELLISCDKSVDLYCFLLMLPVSLRRVADTKIEAGLKKFYPTPAEANPNRRFVENKLIGLIDDDVRFLNLCASKGLSWSDYSSFVKKLYATISQREYFINYMNAQENSVVDDVELVKNIFMEELEDNEELYDILEELSLFWIDDLAYVINIILKNIDKFVKNGAVTVPKVFLKEEDKEFALKLLTSSMVNYKDYTKMISENISNWDLDRLVATDISLLVMGITEATTFDSIPLKVTINEYVDISKYYSTPNSKVFINGLLDKILQQMLKDGRVVKTGRGLVG